MQCLETPTLAHINSLLNAAALWLWLTLRGALHPCLLCEAGHCDGLHLQPLPLLTGVHMDRVHSAQCVRLHPVHAQVTAPTHQTWCDGSSTLEKGKKPS